MNGEVWYQGALPRPTVSCELWSINRWMRWTGWRLYVSVSVANGRPTEEPAPTRIGLVFWGWRNLFGSRP